MKTNIILPIAGHGQRFIDGGYATPTEAATIGVIGALILAWSSKSLNFKSFLDSLMGAVKTSCKINFIIVGAAFLSVAMGYTGIPKQLGQIVNDFIEDTKKEVEEYKEEMINWKPE